MLLLVHKYLSTVYFSARILLMAWLDTLSDMKCYESAIVSTKNQNDTLSFSIKNMCSHFILSGLVCVREDVVIMTKNKNKLSGIKLKYDKRCKFDLFKHSGDQTSHIYVMNGVLS